ncbi:Regulatory protein AfsR [Streptomyces sp. ADI96-02]|uniref:AfsR/SARP family transcriptional regulator n=1 Tax=Streptomyces sp. ADI96-02 TaxID=1522760 RepID=UPI000F5597EC|nr:tetratricopeptide repeat protein [Streptomyces sp. ADI96-02]RPK56830.1 Regulatory protein AfsR [Streptomyces sp. ADI96-02]
MDGQVLGPIGVEVPDGEGVIGTSKAAGLFALLVTSPGCRCSRSEITEILWEGDDGASDKLNWAVKELRKRLGKAFLPHAGKSGFCTLLAPVEGVDYLRFLAGRQRAAALRSPLEKYEQLRRALEEWKDDEPLRGLCESGFEKIRQRMREERVSVVCDLLDAAWRTGEEKWLREEAEKWHARLPGNARIFGFYLIAFGRELPDQECDRLIEEWRSRHGMPDTELQGVIDRLRRGATWDGGVLRPPLPDELPVGDREIVGQESALRALDDAVRAEQQAGRTALILITGMAGVGKSLLARSLARRLRERFPDGTLYKELAGFSDTGVPPAEPEQVLDGLLAAVPPYSTEMTGLEDKSRALRSALARRSVLLVLDDAAGFQQVLPLLPGSGTSAVIITSRDDLGALQAENGVHRHKVGLLSDEEALEVLWTNVSEKDRAKYAFVFTEVARHCGNLPLALAVVQRRLRDRPLQALPHLLAQMKEERARLDVLHLPEHVMSVRVALGVSVRALDTEAKLLLWQLAVHPGPSISWDAVMDIGGASPAMETDRALGALLAANLVEFHSDRYRLHDLVRAFARHHMDAVPPEDKEDLERATVCQVLEHQLQNARVCDRVLDRRRVLPTGEPDGVTVLAEPANPEKAAEALDKEYETIRNCVELALSLRIERYMWLLPVVLVPYQWRRFHLSDALNYLRSAAEVAETHAPPVECARVYRLLAGTQWRRAEFASAVGYLRRAISLSEGDDSAEGRLSLARSCYSLGVTLRKQGEETEAEGYLGRALELYREVSYAAGEAAALNAVGAIHYDRGEHDEALRWCADALAVVERTPERSGRADVLFTLAKVHLARSERNEAVRLYRQACDIYREQEYWPDEAKVRRLFADVLVSAGDTEEAVEQLERVLVLRELMDDTDVGEVRELLERLR